jgi:hypothetical protein
MMQLWQKLAIGRSVDSSLPSDGICRFGEAPAAPALRKFWYQSNLRLSFVRRRSVFAGALDVLF